jgi:hypothetical protein
MQATTAACWNKLAEHLRPVTPPPQHEPRKSQLKQETLRRTHPAHPPARFMILADLRHWCACGTVSNAARTGALPWTTRCQCFAPALTTIALRPIPAIPLPIALCAIRGALISFLTAHVAIRTVRGLLCVCRIGQNDKCEKPRKKTGSVTEKKRRRGTPTTSKVCYGDSDTFAHEARLEC